ncbi:MAG: glycosyltransferase [Bacteroidota bacterium]
MKHIFCSVTNDITYDRRMQRICGSLAKADYEVTLVGRKRKNSKPLTIQNFNTHRLNCFFEAGKLFYLEYNLRLFFYLLSQKVHLFYAVDLDTILPNYLVSKWKRKPCVYDAHEYFSETPEVIRRPFTQKVWEILAYFCIPKMDYCITVGSGLAEIMGKRYGVAFNVVRNVPFSRSKERRQYAKRTSPTILLYQGMLNEGRGLEAMIEAMKGIGQAELWLVGEGDLLEELRNLVKQKELEHKVKFLGFVLPNELQNITLQADIGLNLLENKGWSYYYSLANKAFDYVQAHLPSIHINFPEYEKLNQEYEVFCLIDNLEKQSIQNAIHRLLKDQSYYNELRNNCRKAALKWCWEKEEKRLLDGINRLFSEE